MDAEPGFPLPCMWRSVKRPPLLSGLHDIGWTWSYRGGADRWPVFFVLSCQSLEKQEAKRQGRGGLVFPDSMAWTVSRMGETIQEKAPPHATRRGLWHCAVRTIFLALVPYP